MGDALDGLQDGFTKRLGALAERHAELISQVGYDEAFHLGERAADAAIAPLVWSATIGEKWPTSLVTEFLHISRQALHKRVVNGSALGLPGNGTTWFPVWQFDLAGHQIHPIVTDLIRTFREELGAVDPYLIASWATTHQRELGTSPEAWLASDSDPQQLLRVAKRAARGLSR